MQSWSRSFHFCACAKRKSLSCAVWRARDRDAPLSSERAGLRMGCGKVQVLLGAWGQARRQGLDPHGPISFPRGLLRSGGARELECSIDVHRRVFVIVSSPLPI